MALFGTIWPDPYALAVASLFGACAIVCVATALWNLVPARWWQMRPTQGKRSTDDLLRPAPPI